MSKGDQIPMFPKEPGELRRCTGCGTKYEPIPELHMGGWCPHCGSRSYEMAVPSDYRMTEPLQKSKPKSETPKPGSTEDYTNG